MDPMQAAAIPQIATQMKIQTAVVGKVTETMKHQGEQVVQMLEAVAQLATGEPGKGTQIDAQA